MIQIPCSRCGTMHQVAPHQAGAALACSACANPLVVPGAGAPTAYPPTAVPNAAPVAQPVATAPVATASAPVAQPAAPAGYPPQPTVPTTAPVPPHLVSGSSAGPAVPPAPSISVQSADDVPASSDEQADEEPPGMSRQLVMGGFWIVVLAAVVVAAYAAFEFLPGLFDSSKPAKRDEPPDRPTKVKSTPWTDASQKNLVQRIKGVKVRVTRVEFSGVMAKDENNTVQRGSPFLQVFVRVDNGSQREIGYRSWYGNMFRLRGRKSVATLVDNQNRKYQMMTFQDVVSVKGHVPEATLKTRNHGREKKYVEDVLIFEVPEGVIPEQVEHLRLELPAAAVDLSGQFKFQIPGSMINAVPSGRPLGEEP